MSWLRPLPLILAAGCGLLGGPKAPPAPTGWISRLIEPLAGAGFQMELAMDDSETLHAGYLYRTSSEVQAGEVYRLRYAVRPAGGVWEVFDVGEEMALDKPEKALAVGPNGDAHFLLRSAQGELVHARLDGGAWEREVVSPEGGRYPDLLYASDGRFRAAWFTEDLGTVMDGSWRPGGLWDAFVLAEGKPARGGGKAGLGLFQSSDGVLHAAYVLAAGTRSRGLWHAWQLPGARWATEGIDAPGRVDFGGSLAVTPAGKVHIFAAEGGPIVRHISRNEQDRWWWGLIDRVVEDPLGGRSIMARDGTIHLAAAANGVLYVSTLGPGSSWETRGWPAGAIVGSRPPAIALADDGYLHMAYCAAPAGGDLWSCAPAHLEQVDY